MAIIENKCVWTLTSTGASTLVWTGLETASRITLVAYCVDSADTASIGIEHACCSTGKFERMGSTLYSVSSGVSATIQLDGPLMALRPYVISRTSSSAVIRVVGAAN